MLRALAVTGSSLWRAHRARCSTSKRPSRVPRFDRNDSTWSSTFVRIRGNSCKEGKTGEKIVFNTYYNVSTLRNSCSTETKRLRDRGGGEFVAEFSAKFPGPRDRKKPDGFYQRTLDNGVCTDGLIVVGTDGCYQPTLDGYRRVDNGECIDGLIVVSTDGPNVVSTDGCYQ